MKYTEQTYIVGSQNPLDRKGWFKNLEDMKSPGTDKYQRFFYYYSGMMAHDMETGGIYIWRARETGETISGVLDNDFLYKHNREDSLYKYEGKSFNFFPLSDTSAYELIANKVTDFSIINNVKYPSVKAVEDRLITKVYPYLREYNTVGTGGDYPTVGAAIADSKYNLKLISNVTETNDIVISSTVNLHINGYDYEINFQSFNITFTEYSNKLLFKNCSIKYTYSINKTLFDFNRVDNNFLFDNGIITNNSTSDYTGIINLDKTVKSNFSNYKIILPNYKFTLLINDSNLADEYPHSFNHGIIVGGGTNCLPMGQWGFTGDINGLYLDGSFGMFEFAVGKITNVYGQASIEQLIVGRNSAHNVKTGDLANIELPNAKLGIYGNTQYGTRITNSLFKELTIYSGNINCKSVQILNTTITNSISINGYSIQFTNCKFEDTLTITYNNNTFINCRMLDNIIINGDQNTIDNCTLPNGTITINATADKTIISNTRTLTDIVDNGTNTQLIANNLI